MLFSHQPIATWSIRRAITLLLFGTPFLYFVSDFVFTYAASKLDKRLWAKD